MGDNDRVQREREILELIGDPEHLEKELEEFRTNARVLSAEQGRLISRYPQRWVAVYEGDVAADAPTLADLIRQIDERGLPRGHVIVRYIDKHPRTLIL